MVKLQRERDFTSHTAERPASDTQSSLQCSASPRGILHSSAPSPNHSIFSETHCVSPERGYFASALMGFHRNSEMMADSCAGKTPVTGDTLCGPSRLPSQRGPGCASCWGREAILQREAWACGSQGRSSMPCHSCLSDLVREEGNTVLLGSLLLGSYLASDDTPRLIPAFPTLRPQAAIFHTDLLFLNLLFSHNGSHYTCAYMPSRARA